MESMNENDDSVSPSSIALMEAIDEAIAGESSYPERALFLDADSPAVGRAIGDANREGRAVILCFADNSRLVIRPASPAAA